MILAKSIGRIRNLSIKYKLVLAFLLIVLIPFLFLVGYYQYYIQNILRNKVISNNKELTKQVGQSVNVILQDMQTTTRLVLANNDMTEVLSNNIYDDPVNIFKNIQMIHNFFMDMQYSVLNYQNSFAALRDPYSNVYVTKGYMQSEIRDTINYFIETNVDRTQNINTQWLGTVKNEFTDKYPVDYFITLIEGMRYDHFEKNQGIIMVCVDENSFYEVIKSGSSDPSIRTYIIDEYGKILSSNIRTDITKHYSGFHKMSELLSQDIAFFDDKEKKQVINSFKLSNGSWWLIEVVPYSVIYKDLEEARILFSIFGGLFTVIFVIVSILVIGRIIKPVLDLTKAMRKVQIGDLTVRVTPWGMDEVGQLSDNFNHMVDRINKLIDKINEEEKEKREAEIKMLRAQIKPHFLFNTLSSIRWVAEMNQDKPVSQLIVALSSLLKNSVMNNKEYVTFSEEIENLSNYCRIQEARYGGIFEINYEVGEGTSHCKVLNLMLQPIVENSLMHGFTGMNTQGKVMITSRIKGDILEIEVKDNGIGMTAQKIEQVLSGKDKNRPGGIGILNVHERLRINFGEGYGIKMFSEPGKGVTTLIEIPVILDKENENV